MPKIRKPIDAVVAVTYACNSRCVMCDIWKMEAKKPLEAKEYLKLPSSLKYLNISGGEPFLRPDIVDVVKNMRKACPKAQLIFSSNGLVPELVVEKMKEIQKFYPKIGIGISMDGIGKMHDKIRGIDGAYNKAIKTIKDLQKIGIKNIRLAFTVSTINVDHLAKTYNLAEKLGVEFTMAFAQSSDFYFGGKQNFENPDEEILKQEFDHVIKNEIKKIKPKRWLRAYFTEGLYNFATTDKQPLPAYAGQDFFYLDPFGKIYPSVVHNHIMGDITKNSFDKIWHSKKADTIREKVKKEEKQVWMICTARTAIRKHPIKVGKWIAKKKIKSKK